MSTRPWLRGRSADSRGTTGDGAAGWVEGARWVAAAAAGPMVKGGCVSGGDAGHNEERAAYQERTRVHVVVGTAGEGLASLPASILAGPCVNVSVRKGAGVVVEEGLLVHKPASQGRTTRGKGKDDRCNCSTEVEILSTVVRGSNNPFGPIPCSVERNLRDRGSSGAGLVSKYDPIGSLLRDQINTHGTHDLSDDYISNDCARKH